MVNQKLKDLRQTYGYTQKYVASQCEVALLTYKRVEQGIRKGTIDFWEKAARFYCVPLDYFSDKTSFTVDTNAM